MKCPILRSGGNVHVAHRMDKREARPVQSPQTSRAPLARAREALDRVAPEGKLNAKALANFTRTVETLAAEASGPVDPLEVLALVLEEYDLEA